MILFELPMPAFKIKGIDEYIELTIGEIWGFPNETSYGGGYGAKGILSIRAGKYSVAAVHYFTTGELYDFFKALEKCYETVSGAAVLENTERELELKCEFNKLGHVIVSGTFQANPSVNNMLSFEIITEQTQIKDTLAELKNIYETFGDTKGKRKV